MQTKLTDDKLVEELSYLTVTGDITWEKHNAEYCCVHQDYRFILNQLTTPLFSKSEKNWVLSVKNNDDIFAVERFIYQPSRKINYLAVKVMQISIINSLGKTSKNIDLS